MQYADFKNFTLLSQFCNLIVQQQIEKKVRSISTVHWFNHVISCYRITTTFLQFVRSKLQVTCKKIRYCCTTGFSIDQFHYNT